MAAPCFLGSVVGGVWYLKNQRADLFAKVCSQFKNNHLTEMCRGTEAGSYLRLIDSFTTQFKAQGPSRTCNESKEEESSEGVLPPL